tara:strand:+ start:188 stop:1102 length:915 start_codon:yes stop_codon:yes gene_type:complete
MKIVLYKNKDNTINPGILIDSGVVNIGDLFNLDGLSGQDIIVSVINSFDSKRTEINNYVESKKPISHESVTLLAPLPRPSKILCCIGNYWEHAEREAKPLNMFLKSPETIIGPNDTVILPNNTSPYVFHHEAELAIVIKGPVKDITQTNYLDAIFGYTCFVDVSARGEGRSTWRSGSWMGKSFDTFGPIGPCIVTQDEIQNPNNLNVVLKNNGDVMHRYNTDDMEHRIPELIEFATNIMTLNSGDVLSCGTNHEGLGPLQDNDALELTIESIGTLKVAIKDPLKREWERNVYLGENTTFRGHVN